MHTNETANLHLSQFIGTDIPNPLVDYNGDMQKIDDAVGALQETEGQYDTDITALKAQNGSATLDTTAQTLSEGINELEADKVALESRVTVAEGKIVADETTLATAVNNISTLAGKVSALETQNGNEVLHTTAQTLSGAINEVADEISGSASSIDGRLTALETQNGSDVLVTTAQTLSGAINELQGEISAIPTAVVDTAMSDASEHAVQNKVIKTYVDSADATLQSAIDAVAGEVQSGTLTAGATSVALTFADVTIGANTKFDVYASAFGVAPTAMSVSGQVVTLTFDAQASDVTVAVKAWN